MNTLVKASLSVLLVCMASSASAGFGLSNLKSMANAIQGDTADSGGAVDINGFMEKASIVNQLFMESRTQLALMLADKTMVAELQGKLDTLQKTSDPKERKAQLATINTLSQSALEAANQDQAATAAALASASSESKQKAVNALTNFVIASLRATDLAPAGQSALSSLTANPTQAMSLAGKVSNLKDLVVDVKGIATNSTMALTKIPSIMTKAKIPFTMPTSATTQPVDASNLLGGTSN